MYIVANQIVREMNNESVNKNKGTEVDSDDRYFTLVHRRQMSRPRLLQPAIPLRRALLFAPSGAFLSLTTADFPFSSPSMSS